MALVQVLNCADPCPSSSSSVHSTVMSNEEAEWMDEARCLMMVNHRFIVRLVGVIASSRPMYIVTELAAHGSLKECLRHSDLFDHSDVHLLIGLCMQVISRFCLCLAMFNWINVFFCVLQKTGHSALLTLTLLNLN